MANSILLSTPVLVRRKLTEPPHGRSILELEPKGAEDSASGRRSARACVAHKSKLEESGCVGGRMMCLMGDRGVGECGSGRHLYGVA